MFKLKIKLKKLIRNRIFLGIASILLSLFVSFVLVPKFNEAVANKVEIVRMKKDVEIGEIISGKMIETVEVGGYHLPESVIDFKQKFYRSNRSQYNEANKNGLKLVLTFQYDIC